MDKVVVPDVYQMRASEVKQFQTDELSLVCAAHKWPGNRSLRHYIRQIKRNVKINTPRHISTRKTRWFRPIGTHVTASHAMSKVRASRLLRGEINLIESILTIKCRNTSHSIPKLLLSGARTGSCYTDKYWDTKCPRSVQVQRSGCNLL